MEYLLDSWSLIIILLAAFVIGWAAETAQTFIPRALALSILAWLQTLPEFAVEAAIAWAQDRDNMIANLTGSLRLLVGLGWPMIFFVFYFFHGIKKSPKQKEIHLDEHDFLGVIFLFISILYFCVILAKDSLTVYDSVVLTAIYVTYLVLAVKMPSEGHEEEEDLPWIGKQIVKLPTGPKIGATVFLFVAGGAALWFCVHPFIDTLKKWSIAAGISTFVFVQWVAPFLSEFPEKVSAFNWARQPNKSGMAVMNMVNSNINQWTMLAAMIPLVFSISIGAATPVTFDGFHHTELALTIAQSALGGLLLLDLRFGIFDALAIFFLWFIQFIGPRPINWLLDLVHNGWASQFTAYVGDNLREETMAIYLVWIVVEVGRLVFQYTKNKHVPASFLAMQHYWFPAKANVKRR